MCDYYFAEREATVANLPLATGSALIRVQVLIISMSNQVVAMLQCCNGNECINNTYYGVQREEAAMAGRQTDRQAVHAKTVRKGNARHHDKLVRKVNRNSCT